MKEANLVLYDGHCRFCRASATRLLKLAPQTRLQSFREPGVVEAIPGLSLAACERSLQLVTPAGNIYEGAEAIVRLLLPKWWAFPLRLYFVPGLRQLADGLYQQVARRRFLFGANRCDNGSCSLP